MSDPASWPRDDHRQVQWGDAAPGILVARLPSATPSYEPIIVTTLRRYLRRRAPQTLLYRIAGGEGHFNTLVRVWDLDGRALRRCWRLDREVDPAPSKVRVGRDTGEIGIVLSIPERRLALFQIIVEYARAGVVMPTTVRLARFFGVTRGTIDNDIDVLRAQGRIACTVSSDVKGPRRSIRLVEQVGEASP